MREEWERSLFMGLLPTVFTGLTIAVRILFSPDEWSFVGLVRGVLVGVLSAYVTFFFFMSNPGYLGVDTELERTLAVVVASIVSRDLFEGILRATKELRKRPAMLLEVLRKIK